MKKKKTKVTRWTFQLSTETRSEAMHWFTQDGEHYATKNQALAAGKNCVKKWGDDIGAPKLKALISVTDTIEQEINIEVL